MTRLKKHALALSLAVLVLAGCAAVDVTKTAKGFFSPTDPNSVEILKTRPTQAFDELGTVTVTGFAPDESAKMHNAVRAKSAALGADAVILTEEGILRDTWNLKRWATGVAIHYKGQAMAVAPAPAVAAAVVPVTVPVPAPIQAPIASPLPLPPPPVLVPIVPPAATAPVVAVPQVTTLDAVLKGGQDSFGAEHLPEVRACVAKPQAVLNAKGPGFEAYTVGCANGNVLAVRCEFGNCRVLH